MHNEQSLPFIILFLFHNLSPRIFIISQLLRCCLRLYSFYYVCLCSGSRIKTIYTRMEYLLIGWIGVGCWRWCVRAHCMKQEPIICKCGQICLLIQTKYKSCRQTYLTMYCPMYRRIMWSRLTGCWSMCISVWIWRTVWWWLPRDGSFLFNKRFENIY